MWDRLDLDFAVLAIRSSIDQAGTRRYEKDPKTHRQRRIALDEQPCFCFARIALPARGVERAAMLDMDLPADAYIFSPAPDGSISPKPATMGQRHQRMCARLGWDMNLHQLRHYSGPVRAGSPLWRFDTWNG